jgi:hypothetical protein
VIALGVFVTFILYPFTKAQIRNNSSIYLKLNKVAQLTRIERKGFWLLIQKLADCQIKDDVSEL